MSDLVVGPALDALGDEMRRHIYERILAQPSYINALAAEVPVTRPAVSHHVKVLKAAGLVRQEGSLLLATLEPLPQLRTYFDRLWFEASVGEGWMRQRLALSQEIRGRNLAAPPRRSR